MSNKSRCDICGEELDVDGNCPQPPNHFIIMACEFRGTETVALMYIFLFGIPILSYIIVLPYAILEAIRLFILK